MRVLHLYHHLPGQDLRVGENPVDGIDRAVRDFGLCEQLEPFCGSFLEENSLEKGMNSFRFSTRLGLVA